MFNDLHKHADEWTKILSSSDRDDVLSHIVEGADVFSFLDILSLISKVELMTVVNI